MRSNGRRCSLVTGVAGFSGSHVAKWCLELWHQVVVLDRLSGGFRDQVPAGAGFVEGSVADHALIARLFKQYRRSGHVSGDGLGRAL